VFGRTRAYQHSDGKPEQTDRDQPAAGAEEDVQRPARTRSERDDECACDDGEAAEDGQPGGDQQAPPGRPTILDVVDLVQRFHDRPNGSGEIPE
jgi:hypothetical protein